MPKPYVCDGRFPLFEKAEMELPSYIILNRHRTCLEPILNQGPEYEYRSLGNRRLFPHVDTVELVGRLVEEMLEVFDARRAKQSVPAPNWTKGC
jgi:hypothetical protein